jgi:tetratricopeptide (TPR) repeat protein
MPYDLFISYSRLDNGEGDGRITELVNCISRSFVALAGRPLRPFFDRHAIESMDDWQNKILQGLRESRLLLACLSPSYLNSEYCKWEFVEYLKNEVGRGYVGEGVASVYFVSMSGWDDKDFDRSCDEWVAELRRRQCIDLRHWFHAGTAALLEAEVQDRMAQLNRRLAEQIRRGERAEQRLGNVDAHNPHFVGRVDELRLLRKTFVAPGTIGVLTAVHGLGGLGKTALALEYAHAFAHEYGGGCWQVRCEGRADLLAAVATLASALRVDFSDAEKIDGDLQFQRIVAELRDLAATNEPHHCLLLFDNVDQADLLDPAQTLRLPAADWLHVLATTRLGERDLFSPQQDRAFLPIDELSELDALTLIEQHQPDGRFRDAAERQAALRIVRLLDRFTLAVETAAMYLGSYHGDVSCAEFLGRLEMEGLSGLEDATTDPEIRVRHRETRLTATLLPTVQRLSEPEQLALDYAALLPADCISWEWLEVLVGDQYEEFTRAVADGYLDPWTSLRVHLLSLRLLTPAAEPENARIHRMVQAVVRTRSGFRHDRLRGHLIEYSLQQSRILAKQWTDPDVLWELKPLTAWAFLLIEQDPDKGVVLHSTLGRLLTYVANYGEAEPLLVHALRVTEELFGSFHGKLVSPLSDLGSLFFTTGQLDDAEAMFRRALAIAKKVLVQDHPAIASCLNNLAALLLQTNCLSEAEPLMRRALAIHEQNLGPEHPDITPNLNNLAALLRATNRPSEAEPLMRRALAIDEHRYGPDHPELAIRLSNLAGLLKDTDRITEAEPLMRRALAMHEQSLGPEHPTVATDLNNLGLLLSETDCPSEAEPLMRRALAIDEQSLGPDHPAVANRLNNLALLLGNTNRLSEAESLMRRVVEILLKFTLVTGHEHPNLRTSIRTYELFLEKLGSSPDQAIEQIIALGHKLGVAIAFGED